MSGADAAAPPQAPQRAVAGAGVAVLLAGALVLGADGWERGVFLVLGGLLGLTLYHAAFGFTSAYRRAFAVRDVSGVGAQLVMLALATALFAPVLAQGQAFGHGVAGAVAPVAVQVAIGSAMFGLGMQLAGGCGSGTLYTVGGGRPRMVLVLAAFCLGGFWATLHFGFWGGLPALAAYRLPRFSAGKWRFRCSSQHSRRSGWRSGVGPAAPSNAHFGRGRGIGDGSRPAPGRFSWAGSRSRSSTGRPW